MPEKFTPEEWVPTEPDHVFDPEDYEMSPEELVDVRKAIAACEEDIRMGRTRPAEEVFAEIEQRYKLAG